MVNDVAPELLNAVQENFLRRVSESKILKDAMAALKEGKADYRDASKFAQAVGEALAKAFGDELKGEVLPDGKMYFNIAQRVVGGPLVNNHELVGDYAAQVQDRLNKDAGFGLKGLKPELNQDKVDGIVDRVSREDSFDNIKWILGEPVVVFTMSVIDEAVRANADFHSKAGLSPKIVRHSHGKCCDWCDNLVGTYEYEDVKETGNNVFRRHRHCRCTVEYDPKNGGKNRQDVWSKKWTGSRNEGKIGVK